MKPGFLSLNVSVQSATSGCKRTLKYHLMDNPKPASTPIAVPASARVRSLDGDLSDGVVDILFYMV
jgi:hypothetical protein